ncbi:argininosuccinate lyase [Gymnodinialimonas sp. 2305UL16-5]|uniref:argininosuccinate lyase n=1 Tax=Gymnodinialimonas mytili TaxID=3126503 RepID=UPI00309C1CFA
MYKTIVLLALTGLLAACGVDGAPIPPDEDETPPVGVAVTGQVEVGIAGSS